MSFRRDPSAPRLAPVLLALFLGIGSATVPAWSLDLDTFAHLAPNVLLSRLGAALGLWEQESTPPGAPSGVETTDPETGGESDAGVIIDPNGKPKP